MKPKQTKKLDTEFERLGKEINRAMRPWKNFLMHRDFQSQNIYIKDKKVKFIDFQSARIGPLTYDLASLLRDPYVNVTPGEEKKLLAYYHDKLRQKRIRIKKNELAYIYHLAGLQRNMQALGAYANLALNKSKGHFRQYIPRGLQLLLDGLGISEYEKLFACVADPEIHERCRI